MQKAVNSTSSRIHTNDLIITAMCIALVFVATLFLNIRLPISVNGGLVHLGTAMLFITTLLFGPKKGMIIGAVGMGLFDLFSGWTLWAPFTFVTRGLQAWIVGTIAYSAYRNASSIPFNVMGILASVPVMLAGYYLCEGIIFGNWIAPATSIPGNLLQNAVGLVIAIPVVAALKKLPMFKNK
ncbi:membrane protein [Kurthia zopfii]|uniref:Membrane protein n=1 Tax=Kurthia zopfii TaxID=1650 RepID=A0A2U3A9L7_9BACL|nr:ECF transporter S component [Kurthia zopfii]PWI21141.1 ECF transporter S component [Kurthia zopfii]TDR32864.1 putative membrane protein [Kurthia zopfii]STX11218.1 Thiamine precursor ECF transporter S component HmpT [Kurthia zopfii]VEI05428.1 Thiamine precursor ECF transporter S component HmpT [Kurthia zopfii]GEK32221.1 membrane protein [Kurthia zopfii]